MQESLHRLRDRNGAERANRLRPLGRLPSALRLARELQLRANRSSGSCFNVFRALRVTEEEAKHLAFIAQLLDPRGSHGQGDLFLRRFLEAVASSGQRFRKIDAACRRQLFGHWIARSGGPF
jgi:hypothetical protein